MVHHTHKHTRTCTDSENEGMESNAWIKTDKRNCAEKIGNILVKKNNRYWIKKWKRKKVKETTFTSLGRVFKVCLVAD